MSTSGVTTWKLTASEIIDAALRKLSAISSGVSATTQNRTDGLQALNGMLKLFQTKGMPLWAISEQTLTLTATRTYSLGIGQTINVPAPLKVIQAYLKDTSTGYSVPLDIRTRYDYNLMQPASTTSGCPVHVEYEPGNQIGTLHVYPLPDTYSIANRQIVIVYQRPFEDMVNLTDNLDFPQYWHDAVVYGLATRLAPEFGMPIQDRTVIKAEAKEFLEEALSFGTEEGSLFIMPAWR